MVFLDTDSNDGCFPAVWRVKILVPLQNEFQLVCHITLKLFISEYGNGNERDQLGEGVEEQCKTFYETACTTKYVEKQPGKFVGDTSCEKLPVELCGAGCKVEEGEEECHDKEVDTLVDVPEEVSTLHTVSFD